MESLDLMLALKRHKVLVIACGLLGAVIAIAVTATISPIYIATARLLVSEGFGAQGPGDTYPSIAQRVNSYAAVVDSPLVAKATVDDLNLDMTPHELAHKVGGSSPPDTVLIDVSVSDESPARAAQLANSVAANFSKVMSEAESGVDARPIVKFTLVKPAEPPSEPSSPRRALNIAIGLAVGASIGAACVVLRALPADQTPGTAN